MEGKITLENLKTDYYDLLDPKIGRKRIIKKVEKLESKEDYLLDWLNFSKIGESVYPSQGLLTTPYDYLNYSSLQMLPYETIIETLRVRRFFLEVFNHPYRMHYLHKVNSKKFSPPPKIKISPLDNAVREGLFLSVGDFGASVLGSKNERVSRRERYAQGPFVKLGKQARSIFFGSAQPDVWNTAASISTMAACHCLATLPRNGLMSNVKRQSDLAKEVFLWLEKIENELLSERNDRKIISDFWKSNVCAALEASPEKALVRTEGLYESGVRCFKVYSPEPGDGIIKTIKALRNVYDNSIEIFAKFAINVAHAKKIEESGANGIFIGIGGGGRCITGVRTGSAIDWPLLLYKLRGEIKIPVIVDGGASDHIATTLLLGASGINVSRAAAGGTIESPGGALYYSDSHGKLFKPYGGEASPRTKYLDGKIMPFDIPSFVEGETGQAFLNYSEHKFPSLTYNLHIMTEDAILALVFRGVDSIHSLHKINPSPLGRITSSGEYQRNTH